MFSARRFTIAIFMVLALTLSFTMACIFPMMSRSAGALSLATATSIATGQDSACAVIDYKVKCWGDDSYGKLGNDSAGSSTKPVAVYTKAPWTENKEVCDTWFIFCTKSHSEKVQHAGSVFYGKTVTKVTVGTNHACALASARVYCWGSNESGELGDGNGAWLKTEPSPVAVATGSGSALSGKEVVDISAGDGFTCALSTDGSVACWGKGADGRLGTNSTSDKKLPTTVYTGNGSALSGKRAVKLAKASGSTMCALVANGGNAMTNTTPVCWGYGIDDGRALGANGSANTTCNKSSPTSKPTGTTTDTIYTSAKPTAIPGATIASMDGQDYVTGLSATGQVYYWGKYGSRQTVSYTNVASCTVDCRGKVSFYEKHEPTRDRADIGPKVLLARAGTKPGNPGGGQTVKTKTHSYTSYGGKNNVKYNVKPLGKPGGSSSPTKVDNPNDSSGNGSCRKTTHYGFTKSTTNTNIGQKSTTQPSATSLTQQRLVAVSGNVYSGLVCGATSTSVVCDGNGTTTKAGQLGNGSSSQVSGPKQVVSTGWLAGKQVTQLSTGGTGYTCAIAGGSVGCWGENGKGQLGVGDKKDKNVPVGVGL